MRLTRKSERSTDGFRDWIDRTKETVSGRTEDGSGGLLDRTSGRLEGQPEDESRGWFARTRAKYGLGVLLMLVGAVLFLFPEPITTSAGIALMTVGTLIWLVGRIR